MSQDLFRSFVNSGSKMAPRAATSPSDSGALAAASPAKTTPPSGKYHTPPWGSPSDVEWAPLPREGVCHRWFWKGACSGRCPFFHRGPLPLWVAREGAADGRDAARAPSRPRPGYPEGRAALAASGVAAQLAFALGEGEAARARNPGAAARLKAVGAIAAGVAALEGALGAKDEEVERAKAELKALGGGCGGGGGGGGDGEEEAPGAAAAAAEEAAAAAESPAEGGPAAAPAAELRKRIAVLQGTRIELRKNAEAWRQALAHAKACAGAVAAVEDKSEKGKLEPPPAAGVGEGAA